jgi:hypothetical protein
MFAKILQGNILHAFGNYTLLIWVHKMWNFAIQSLISNTETFVV